MNISQADQITTEIPGVAADLETAVDLRWGRIVAALDYAFQPVVNIYSGFVFGFEALLRNWREAGFNSLPHLFDTAYGERRLYMLDLLLRGKAIEKFARIPFHARCKLLFNLDNRVLLMPDYSPGNTGKLLSRFGLHPSSLVFEISERHEFEVVSATEAILAQYKQIAIDDFGSGHSGLQLLFHSDPEFIKIDRFFIADIDADVKKRLLVSSMVNLAHALGIQVIAEGVETEAEFFACKTLGCDLVQGYLVQRPVSDIGQLRFRYDAVNDLNMRDRRDTKTHDLRLLRGKLERVEPIRQSQLHDLSEGINLTFEFFQKDKNHAFFPVINDNDEPLGIIREKDLKEFVYSRYGKDLLFNRAVGKTMMEFVSRCPVADIHSRIETILEVFANDPNNEGMILTENGRYAGFLGALSLIRVVNENNMAMASDQNPLTRLPGNNLVNKRLTQVLEDTGAHYTLAYFDIDHFKAFNDVYGFRMGDRAILLFADILKDASLNRFFIGHIGGDDFFSIFKSGEETRAIRERVRWIIGRFAEDAISLYDSQDRQRGYLKTEDRRGHMSKFPLLSVSAGVLHMRRGRRVYTLEEVGAHAAALKKMAKRAVAKISYGELSKT
jgi:diguanylate cyclase (GGDEF)-like protein